MKSKINRKRVACLTGNVSSGGAGNASRFVIGTLADYYNVKVFSREVGESHVFRNLLFRIKNSVVSRVLNVLKQVYVRDNYVWSRNYVGLFSSGEVLSDDFDFYFIFSLSFPVVSDKVLESILKSGKPVFWRLSDMRPFTGGCHYSNGCLEFINYCSCCPAMTINSRVSSRFLFRNYHAGLDSQSIHLMFPSSWLLGKFELFSSEFSCKTSLIPTMVNPVFKVRSSKERRGSNIFNDDRKVVLFGADNFDFSARKGWSKFLAFVQFCIDTPDFFETFVIGCFGTSSFSSTNNNVRVFGRICQGELSEILSLSSVYVNLSEEDNLPNALMEALACGVCVVSTFVGGIDTLKSELPFSVEVVRGSSEIDLLSAIKKVLTSNIDRNTISDTFHQHHSEFIMHEFVKSISCTMKKENTKLDV